MQKTIFTFMMLNLTKINFKWYLGKGNLMCIGLEPDFS